MDLYILVPPRDLQNHHQVELLNLRMVLDYKLNKKGHLKRFKAQLVVRGDQQLLSDLSSLQLPFQPQRPTSCLQSAALNTGIQGNMV